MSDPIRPFTTADVGKRVVVTERDGTKHHGKIIEHIYDASMLRLKMDHDQRDFVRYPEDMCELEE